MQYLLLRMTEKLFCGQFYVTLDSHEDPSMPPGHMDTLAMEDKEKGHQMPDGTYLTQCFQNVLEESPVVPRTF